MGVRMFTRFLKLGVVYLLAMGLLVSTVSLGLAQEPDDGVVVLIKEFSMEPDRLSGLYEFTRLNDHLYFYRLIFDSIPGFMIIEKFELWQSDGTKMVGSAHRL